PHAAAARAPRRARAHLDRRGQRAAPGARAHRGDAARRRHRRAAAAPPPRDPETDGRGVRARIELYAQAAQAARDPARKVGLYEKLAAIWEDELGQPARAIEEIEKILVIEPQRRSAILALARNAQRAGDH